ncbi:MAG: Sensor protein ZraS [Chlamydiae bacterium]|nr:Sensor protein ZraS [Chlamydiota bacterium]
MPELTSFSQFTKQSARLERAYEELKEQIAKLKTNLTSSRQTLEQIVTHMSDGLIFVTLEGVVSLFNGAAANLTGCTQDEVLGSPFWNCFSDELFGFSLREALHSHKPSRRMILTLSDEKQSRDLEVTFSSIPDKGVLLLLRDRTEIETLERSLRHDEKLRDLGEMAATLAHEIRNPLGGIEGFAALLKQDLRSPKQLRMIEAIQEGTKSVNRLVSQVLSYAHPLTLHFTPVDLVELLEQTVVLANQARFPCTFTTSLDSFPLSCDRNRLLCTFLSLIRNGIEAGSPQVTISLDKGGTVTIQDKGKGISPSLFEKIFTPFFTTKTKGTGLGLAEAKKVIEAHGGKLSITSQENKGTEVVIQWE